MISNPSFSHLELHWQPELVLSCSFRHSRKILLILVRDILVLVQQGSMVVVLRYSLSHKQKRVFHFHVGWLNRKWIQVNGFAFYDNFKRLLLMQDSQWYYLRTYGQQFTIQETYFESRPKTLECYCGWRGWEVKMEFHWTIADGSCPYSRVHVCTRVWGSSNTR